jgi:single-stranded-DNA-specific exonuclease
VTAAPSSRGAARRRAPGARRWVAVEAPAAAVAALQDAGYSPVSAQLLARRGIADPGDAARFLAPSLEQMHDPQRLAGVAEAVARLSFARERGTAVAVVGDYDVDGVTSTALLVAVFRHCGLVAEPVLPHRLREGYGFQAVHVDRARELGCGLIVTVDCGTTAVDAVSRALALGIEVVITDHHLPGEPLPPGAILVNPRQSDEGYPFRELAGVGLAFKLAVAFLAKVGKRVDLGALLRLAALGTIADLAPLVGENRVIAALGLAEMASTRSLGLRALMQRAAVRAPVRAVDVGYKLGPRLNAAGRLDSAEQALRLLLTRDATEAATLAEALDAQNRARQAEEAKVVQEAFAHFEQRDPLPPILVASSPEWHKGVVGIAAGRIARELGRPTLLLGESAGLATGSGRSVPGIALHAFLDRWRDGLVRFGGHAQAVGLTVERERLDALIAAWEQEAAGCWPRELLEPRHEYELELDAAQVDRRLLAELERLQPFGQGNPEPLLRVGPLTAVGAARTFGVDHLKLTARGPSGALVSLLGWGFAPRASELGGTFEALGAVEVDDYRGGPVLRLLDVHALAGTR